MTVDVHLVTCAHLPTDDPDTPLIAAALRARGATVATADWRDPGIDWASAPLTIIRSPWDYVDARDEFVAWAQRVGVQSGVWNPPALIEWNTHKSYLLDLARQGAPVVPTVLLLRGSAAALDGICDAQGWNAVVVKPAVGIGALGAGRFDVGDPAGQAHLDALLQQHDVLVQPFVSSVVSEGELSVVVIDNAVTHALRKRPSAGDYRVHEEWGGVLVADHAPASAQELALRVVGVLPTETLYARIDMLAIGDLWHVLEVEATEPSLWLDHAPPAQSTVSPMLRWRESHSPRRYAVSMLAVNGGLTGALLGLVIGIALSVYVARVDYAKRQAGVRTRAEYRLSLLFVPVILAVVGGAIGAAIT